MKDAVSNLDIYVLFWIARGLSADAAQAAGLSGPSRRRAGPELRAGTPSEIRPTMVVCLFVVCMFEVEILCKLQLTRVIREREVYLQTRLKMASD